MTETIKVTVSYKEPITFDLRMIGIAEEEKLRQKMFGLTDEEKAEKSYQNNVDLLADLSEAMPTALREVTEDKPVPASSGEPGQMEIKSVTSIQEVPLTEAKTVPSGVVKDYFSDRTVVKERLAEYAVRAYFLKLTPDVVFS